MTEEHKRKLQEARTNLAKFKPSVNLESFTYKNENYRRLYFDPERNLAVYRRTNSLSDKLIAYEVVVGKGPDNRYPSDNDFGTLGWCYTGTDSTCKKSILDYHGIAL